MPKANICFHIQEKDNEETFERIDESIVSIENS
jgi:hypothetical protein